jgi:phosphoribosylformylglycinamidine cyclo-ligase
MGAARPDDSVYSSAGVDYAALDSGKRDALTAALATSSLLADSDLGCADDDSRGEPAFVFKVGDTTLALVLEGLGTKSVIARMVEEETGSNRFGDVAYDTVAAIVNDLCCVGATPLVVNAYFATGSSGWYTHVERHAALVAGWTRACIDVGATWGGGESPSLPGLVSADDIELAGSAVGLIPPGVEPILGQDLRHGDEIIFVASTGLHANGASLARMLASAGNLKEGYSTMLPSGETSFGEALLAPTKAYSPLAVRLIQDGMPIHYLSHITGHGMLKLMRPSKPFTYVIHRTPAVPEVLEFIVEQANMDQRAAYSTFNMGCGFAIYCAAGAGKEIIAIANELEYDAYVAGHVKNGPRRVILEDIDVAPYEDDAMDLSPRRAA